MTTELRLLAASVILGLVHLIAASHLISFQRGYQASARTLTAMDDMLETLIEHTGTVGL